MDIKPDGRNTFDITDKESARGFYRKVRGNIPPQERAEKSRMIAERLFGVDEYKDAESVLCYSPIGSEADASLISRNVLERGKILLLPVSDPQRLTMSARRIDSLSGLICGTYGIPEPPPDSEECLPEKIDVVIVPAVCFDTRGYRIGYGKGYYDRFLRCCRNAFTVGIAYEECICERAFPDEHDIAVDITVTDINVYRGD